MRELKTRLDDGKVQAFAPATVTTTQTSAAINLQGYNSALIEWNFGASGDTLSGSIYFVGTVTECATSGGSYTTVAAADLIGSVPTVDDPAEDSAIYLAAYVGTKQYIKVGVAVTGTHTNGTPIGITVFRGHKLSLNA